MGKRRNRSFWDSCCICLIAKKKEKILHRPGIEPGPPAWQASILPLNQRCLLPLSHKNIHTDCNFMFSAVCSCGRVVKATHSKWVSLWERRFESYQLRCFWQNQNKTTCSRWGSNSQPRHIFCTVYKYRALTDCATGANCYLFPKIDYCKVWGSNPRNLTIMRA